MQLKDMKMIVTGGAQGMGAHFARRLHEAGAQVAVGDVNEAALEALPSPDRSPREASPRIDRPITGEFHRLSTSPG
jgi:NAD(P)-dependent dehydrogenase (short-subunit alcohol dehydrogenase family)